MGEFDLSVKQVKERLDGEEKLTLIDVREPWEVNTVRLEVPEVQLIPMKQVPGKLKEMETDAHIVVFCHSGARSGQVVQFMRSKGFTNCWNMAGGIDAWALQIQPGMFRY